MAAGVWKVRREVTIWVDGQACFHDSITPPLPLPLSPTLIYSIETLITTSSLLSDSTKSTRLTSFVSLYTILEGKICLLDWFACLLDIQDTLFATFDSIHPPNVRGDIDGYTTTYVLILLQQHYKTTRCSFLSFFLFCTFPHNKPFFALS